MTTLAIKRVNTLPGSPDPSTLYVTKNTENSDLVDLHFTSTTGSEVRRTMNPSDIDEPIEPFLLMGV